MEVRTAEEALTVTTAEPWMAPLAAVMVAVPAATPFTRPLAETETVPGALEVQVTELSYGVTVVPSEKCPVAWRSAVAPTLRVGPEGARVMDVSVAVAA